MRKDIIKTLSVILLFIIILSFSVNAFGIGSKWWKGNPLIVQPGETREVSLWLQNLGDDATDVTVQIILQDGEEIAEILGDKTVKVPKGVKDQEVKLLVRIPKDAQPGDEWGIITSFRQIGNEGDSPVQINSGITHVFGVNVPKPPKETGEATKVVEEIKKIKSISLGPAILIIIAVILLVFMLVKRKRPKKGKK